MPRVSRIEEANYPYHVIQRGNRRQRVFLNDSDKNVYLEILKIQAKFYGIEIWAYCLMDNHVHLILYPRARKTLTVCIGVSHVFMNTGTGFVEDTSSGWNTYAQYGDFTNLSTQMIDVNGDGLPDMVITTNGNRANAIILLNSGSGWSLYQGNIGDFNFFDYGTQFLDANADGMMGYLTYENGKSPELYLNANKPVDMLIGVNNGIGASTSIQYDSDFHFKI